MQKNEDIQMKTSEVQEQVQEQVPGQVQEQVQEQVPEQVPETNKVEDAIKEALTSYKQELKIEKERSKMSESERLTDELNEKMQELEKEREEFNTEKRKVSTERTLIKEGLPSSFANFLIGSNENESLRNIADFKREYRSAIKQEYNAKIQRGVPKSSGTGKVNSMKLVTEQDYAQKLNEMLISEGVI